jgi:hypothetical protein
MSSIFSKSNSIDKNYRKKSHHDATADKNTTTDKKNIVTTKKSIIDSLSDSDDYIVGEKILSISDITNAIPSTATKEPNVNLQKIHVEWRWRFFNLKGRKLIEISQKSTGNDRIYVNNVGNWIKFKLNDNWDQYIVDTKYYYADNK